MHKTRIWRVLLAGTLIAVLALSLLPVGPDVPTTGWDKANHLLAFSTLAVLVCLSYPARLTVFLPALLFYGALIEVLQSLTAYRFAEWSDLLADALGILLGWGLWQLARGAMAR